ncbi:hypothetical protein [Longitalea arenae]|uniref:hypothetical protein n=1 Tax=Longitalea arenae TaxID=2812558 RepID=UPI00196891F4|nr:hypothetical protein [Longitalea arenae]
MKTSILSFFALVLMAFSSPAFSANIPITGENTIIGTSEYTFYATPVAQGATYTWSVYSGTIVAQNTDPAAGILYVTIRWTTPGLYQDYVEIADNQGNAGSFGVYVGVNPFAIYESRKDGENILASYTYVRFEGIGIKQFAV